ncbi:MAG: hypothetical protein HKN63_08765 [Rhodobacteraceae bacterium]|nr:hypothetical protein [Paracoccaceae bacterium]
MCGEIDEHVLIGQEMLERARALTKRMGLPAPDAAREAPTGLAEADGRAAYMERIFRTGLAQALNDVARAGEDEMIDALASQAIALARLAGFLAGQLPPEADLYRAVIEAATAGHSEPREMAEEQAHHHHHHHH